MPVGSFNKPDSILIKRSLLIWLGFLGTVLLAGFTVKSGNVLLIAGFLVLPFALMLMNRPDIAFLFGVIADTSKIPIGNIQYLTLGVLTQLLIIAAALLVWVLRGDWKKICFSEDRPLKWFVAIIIILMAMRGAGLRALGSSSWGGMIYIRILVSIAFYFAVRNIRVSPKQTRIIIVGGIVAGVVGSLVQRTGFVSSLQEVSTLVTSVGSQRLMWLLPVLYAVFPVILAVKWRIKIFGVLLWLSTMALMGLTGFRSRLVSFLMVTFIYGFIRAGNRIRYCLTAGVAGLALWIMIVGVSPLLPLSLQRAVSFVPGAQISFEADKAASGSVEWRVDIWKYCLQKSPEYLFIGRGSSFNIWETVGSMSGADIRGHSPWFAFQTRSYHSGPLTLLIDYGLPGLLVGLWLAFTLGSRVWKVAGKLANIDSIESRYSVVLISWLVWELVAFFLVYGDMPKFSTLIAMGAIVTVLSSSVLMNGLSGKKEPLRTGDKATGHIEDAS